PYFLERVLVVMDSPRHLLSSVQAMPGVQVELVPGQGILAVEQIGSHRIAWVAIHRDTNEVPRDRFGTGIDQATPLGQPIDMSVVTQARVVVINKQTSDGGRRRVLGIRRRMEFPLAGPSRRVDAKRLLQRAA